MSLQIGYTQRYGTNRERIWLASDTHENLIVIHNKLGRPGIAFDSNQCNVLSATDGAFLFSKDQIPFATIASNHTTFSSTVSCARNVEIGGELRVGSGFFTSSFAGSNLKITVPTTTTPNTYEPFMSFKSADGATLLESAVNPAAHVLTSFAGNVGIGTMIPVYGLHVMSDAYVQRGLTADDSVTTPLVSYGNRYVDFATANRVTIKGNTYVDGTFQAADIRINTTSTDTVIANCNLLAPSITITNEAPVRDTISILHNGVGNTCNVLNFNVKREPNMPPLDALTMDHAGRVGLGTTTPKAILHAAYDPRYSTCNIMHVSGVSESANFVCDLSGNVGIGTTAPMFRLHIHNSNEEMTSPMVAIVSESSNAPLLEAFSNATRVLSLTARGNMTIGDRMPSDDANLSVASNIYAPLILTEGIKGVNEENTIDMLGSGTCNARIWHGEDIVSTVLTSTCNLVTNYFFASNYRIPAFDVLNTEGYFQVRLPYTNITSPLVSFTDGLEDNSQLSPNTDGRVRINTVQPNLDKFIPNIGLHVIGGGTTSMKVSSSQYASSLILSRSLTNSTTLSHTHEDNGEQNTFRIQNAGNPNIAQFVIDPTAIKLMANTRVENGKVGINIADGQSIGASLHTTQSVRFDNGSGGQIAFVFAPTPGVGRGNFGFGIDSPSFPFHVNMQSMFSQDANFNQNILLTNGNVFISGTGRMGIGVTDFDSKYRAAFNGDVNVLGDIYLSGQKIEPTYWSLLNDQIFVKNNRNVGIGTTNTRGFSLYVQNPAFFNSNVTFQGFVTTQGGISSISDQSLKHNLKAIEAPIERLQSLSGYEYDRIDTGKREYGLIAQDVQKVFPELVRPMGDGSELLSIAYGNMAAVFVEAIKKLDTRVSQLETLLQSLGHSVEK